METVVQAAAALAALGEATYLHGSAVPRLIERGIEAARAGDCDEAKSILRRLGQEGLMPI